MNKSRKVYLSLLTLILVISLVFTGCSAPASEAPAETGSETAAEETAKPITIKFANNGPADPEHPMNVAASKFKDFVEERSDGRLSVELYPAGQLGDARTITEGVQLGTIEMGDIENGPMGRFVPQASLWDLPYLFRDLEHAHKVLDGPIGDKVREQFIPIGIRVLAFNDGGFRYLTNSKHPISAVEDMNGLKIRVMESKIMIDSINAFGATAVPMAFGELYSGLDQGVVDGQENPLDLIHSMKFYEVQKYVSLSEHFYYPRQYIISETFYQSLPDDLKTIVEEAAKEACQIQRDELAKYTESMIGALTAEGMEVIEDFDKEGFAELARKVYPDFYETIGNGDTEAGKALIEEVLAQ